MPKAQAEYTPAFQNLQSFISDLDGIEVSAGFMGNDAYENGVQVGDVAKKNEFGNIIQQILPRPFMRPAMIEMEVIAPPLMISKISSGIQGKLNVREIFEELGQISANKIVSKIEEVQSPPLSPYTLVKRRERGNTSTKPLEDSLKMKNSVTYEVSQ